MSIKFGCHTYSWQMSFDKYVDQLPTILSTMSNSGFKGVEPDISMLGPYRNNPYEMKKRLDNLDMELSAINLGIRWDNLEKPENDKNLMWILNYLKQFPDSLLVLLNWSEYNRQNLSSSEILNLQKMNITSLNNIAKVAISEGVHCTFHPNSAPGSLFHFKEDYDVMFSEIDERYLGFTPDTGHIVNGGMDALNVIKTSRNLINHVHFKDISSNRQFASMGEGIINHSEIVTYLRDTNYAGWIMVEDESEFAKNSPNDATKHSGLYIKEHFIKN